MSTRDITIAWSTLESEPTILDSNDNVQVIREYKHHKIHLANLNSNTTYRYDVLKYGSDKRKGVLTTYISQ